MSETFLARAKTIKDAVALVVVGGCAIVAGVALTGASISACSSERGPSSSGRESPSSASSSPIDDSDPGSIGLRLTIGNGVNLYSLSYTCTGPSPIPPGTVNFNDAQSVEYVLGGITPGSGYQCTLTGFDSNGDACTGTTTSFSVLSGQVSNAGVVVTCTVPTDAAVAADVNVGSTYFDAAVQLVSPGPNSCPGISAFSVSPAEVTGSQPAQLSVSEVGPQSGIGADGGPSSSNIAWSATCSTPPCGTFLSSDGGVDGTSANPTFVCGAIAQAVTITVQLTQYETTLTAGGPVTTSVCNGVTFTSMSSTINCEGNCVGAGYGSACGTAGQICNGGGSCIVPTFEVVRVGNGAAPGASNTTAPVFIDQYSLGGSIVGTSIALPAAASGSNQPLTLVGSDVSEGDLTTSADGRFLVMAGHGDTPGTLLAGSNCVAAFIGPGTTFAVNTSTALPNALSAGGFVRSAVSLDGNEVWVSGIGTGTTGGLWYTPGDLQLVATSTTKTARLLRIAGGQLYGDSNANPPGLFTVGSGTPNSGSPALTELPGLPTTAAASPYGFVFLTVNGVQTLYIADDRTTSGGGIGKLTLSGGTWSVAWTQMGISPAADGGTTGVGYRGLAGYVTGNTVTLMASTGMPAGSANSLVVIVDTGSPTGPASQTVIATAGANENFRGVALPAHN